MCCLSNDDVTFRPGRTYLSGGTHAFSVAVADVNGDGKPDLIVGNECSSECPAGSDGRVGVLLENGDGTFQAARSYDSVDTGLALSQLLLTDRAISLSTVVSLIVACSAECNQILL
jgi:hypothetical protein